VAADVLDGLQQRGAGPVPGLGAEQVLEPWQQAQPEAGEEYGEEQDDGPQHLGPGRDPPVEASDRSRHGDGPPSSCPHAPHVPWQTSALRAGRTGGSTRGRTGRAPGTGPVRGRGGDLWEEAAAVTAGRSRSPAVPGRRPGWDAAAAGGTVR